MFLTNHPSQSSIANRLLRSRLDLPSSKRASRSHRRPSRQNPRLQPGPRPVLTFQDPSHIHSVMSCVPAPTQTRSHTPSVLIPPAPPRAPVLPFVSISDLADTSVAEYKVNPARRRFQSKSVPRALHRVTSFNELCSKEDKDCEPEIVEEEPEQEGREELCQPCWTKRPVFKWHKNLVAHRVQETPPLHISVLLVIQLLLVAVTITTAVWTSLTPHLHLQKTPETSGRLLSSIFFFTGLCTLVQVFVGIRLPIIHGPGLTYLLFMLPFTTLSQSADHMFYLGVITGSFQAVCGLTGLSSLMLRYLVGPLGLLPTGFFFVVQLIPLAERLFEATSFLSCLLLLAILLFTLVMGVVRVPFCLPSTLSTSGSCMNRSYPLFRVLGILMAFLITILIDFVVNDLPTTSNPFQNVTRPEDTPWGFIPYPGQFRGEKGEISMTLVLIQGVPLAIICMLRSLGDYLATARFFRAPPPPVHAVNRAQLMDGLLTIVSGMFGLPPVSSQIGFVGVSLLTNVASRSLHIALSIILLLLACLPRILVLFGLHLLRYSGALLALYLALIFSATLSNLCFVSLLHARNQVIIGLSLGCGYAVAPNVPVLPIVLGPLIALFLDLVLPINCDDDNGRKALREDPTRFSSPTTESKHRQRITSGSEFRSVLTEGRLIRGSQRGMYVGRDERKDTSIYALPIVSTEWLMGRRWAECCPVLPSFTGHKTWRKREETESESEEDGGRIQGRLLRIMRSVSQGDIPANPEEPLL